jgi:hypothetical protein
MGCVNVQRLTNSLSAPDVANLPYQDTQLSLHLGPKKGFQSDYCTFRTKEGVSRVDEFLLNSLYRQDSRIKTKLYIEVVQLGRPSMDINWTGKSYSSLWEYKDRLEPGVKSQVSGSGSLQRRCEGYPDKLCPSRSQWGRYLSG